MFLDEFDHIIKISIHALREEGDADGHLTESQRWISIHALREEGDRRQSIQKARILEFQSTPSARRATYIFCTFWGVEIISIHALREEGDMTAKRPLPGQLLFQSTPSARRATSVMKISPF